MCDGFRQSLILPGEGEPAPMPPRTPAIDDRYLRAEAISTKIFKELHGSNRELVERVRREALAVIHENDALNKLTPATTGRFVQSLGEWHWVVRDGRARAELAAAGSDLWIGRYWRALSAHHKGLRRRRPRHLEDWAPSPANTRFKTRWDLPNELLGGSGEDFRADKNGNYLRRALEIIGSAEDGAEGMDEEDEDGEQEP